MPTPNHTGNFCIRQEAAVADILDDVLRMSPELGCAGTASPEPIVQAGKYPSRDSSGGLRQMPDYGWRTDASYGRDPGCADSRLRRETLLGSSGPSSFDSIR